MRKYTNATFLALLFLFSLTTAFGEGLNVSDNLQMIFPSLSSEAKDTLLGEREYTRYFYDNSPPHLFPEIPQKMKTILLDLIKKNEVNLGVESIFILDTPGLVPDSETGISEKKLLGIYNTLRSVSTLSGIEYYSASRKKMRTLFKRAFFINGPDNLEILPDVLVQKIPEESAVYLFQEDLTFGNNISEAVYRFNSPIISLSLTNLTTMKYALLPFIREQGMQTHLIVIPLKDSIVFYGYIGVNTFHLLGLEKMKKSSFYNRLKALYNWFSANFVIS